MTRSLTFGARKKGEWGGVLCGGGKGLKSVKGVKSVKRELIWCLRGRAMGAGVVFGGETL